MNSTPSQEIHKASSGDTRPVTPAPHENTLTLNEYISSFHLFCDRRFIPLLYFQIFTKHYWQLSLLWALCGSVWRILNFGAGQKVQRAWARALKNVAVRKTHDLPLHLHFLSVNLTLKISHLASKLATRGTAVHPEKGCAIPRTHKPVNYAFQA